MAAQPDTALRVVRPSFANGYDHAPSATRTVSRIADAVLGETGTLRRCKLLREDPDLAEAIPLSRRDEAIERCMALQTTIGTRCWNGEAHVGGAGGIGLLILEGLIVRRVSVGGRRGAELLGAGDVLSCVEPRDELPALELASSCSVLEPLRVAVLDAAFVDRELTHFPQLAAALAARIAQRSRNLAVNLAIITQSRVDARLHMLLWHLAGRWGRVRSGGVVLPLRLTHSLLAEMVASRRPTVSSALSGLARRGLVRCSDDGWVLAGDAPGDTGDLEVLHTGDGGQLAHAGSYCR